MEVIQTGFINENHGNSNQPYDWQGQIGSFIPHEQQRTASSGLPPQPRILHNNRKSPASLGYSYAGEFFFLQLLVNEPQIK
ncbi:hypothetical protein ANCCAN_30267 [Ancylostoma caninum]|uniref:Uncharacterized protein n=1 Tax=Ancylostoma caninum TaxID=29170 RepID=A0A368EWF3_ANCCA|nr:hypothetical protein ANCCAN_30267 [Ancylostoma caninum]